MISNNKKDSIATICLGALAAMISSALPLVNTDSAQAQIKVTSTRYGTCYTGRMRQPCYYPSANGLYSYVKSIQITSGSGADVTWQSYIPVNFTFGWNAGGVITVDGKTFLPVGQSSCVIGFPQYRQNPECQNPYRGSQRFVRVVVKPHNSNWQTNFRLNPEN